MVVGHLLARPFPGLSLLERLMTFLSLGTVRLVRLAEQTARAAVLRSLAFMVHDCLTPERRLLAYAMRVPAFAGQVPQEVKSRHETANMSVRATQRQRDAFDHLQRIVHLRHHIVRPIKMFCGRTSSLFARASRQQRNGNG